MKLHKDLREFVELLNSNDVEFVVVGAYATQSAWTEANPVGFYDPEFTAGSTIGQGQRDAMHHCRDGMLVLALET